MISEKLQAILDIKDDIKLAINEKGGSITDETQFSEYPAAIRNIAGSSTVELPQLSNIYTFFRKEDSLITYLRCDADRIENVEIYNYGELFRTLDLDVGR